MAVLCYESRLCANNDVKLHYFIGRAAENNLSVFASCATANESQKGLELPSLPKSHVLHDGHVYYLPFMEQHQKKNAEQLHGVVS